MNNKISVLHTGKFTQQVSQLQHNQTNENNTINASDERKSKQLFDEDTEIKRQRKEWRGKRAGICKTLALILAINNIKRLKSV